MRARCKRRTPGSAAFRARVPVPGCNAISAEARPSSDRMAPGAFWPVELPPRFRPEHRRSSEGADFNWEWIAHSRSRSWSNSCGRGSFARAGTERWRRAASSRSRDRPQDLVAVRSEHRHGRTFRQFAVEFDAAANDFSGGNHHAPILPVRAPTDTRCEASGLSCRVPFRVSLR